jgi:Domain of unknown function (DUF5069)
MNGLKYLQKLLSTAAERPTSGNGILVPRPATFTPVARRHSHWLAKDARMDALDLTLRPPRSPREPLSDLDLLMLARTVDKLRATLPGGNIGAYQITGFTSRLLLKLGIAESALRGAIARAGSDAEVAAWIREHSDPAAYPEINAGFEQMTVGERLGDAEFVARYPLATQVPPETCRLDLLAADDAAAFAKN